MMLTNKLEKNWEAATADQRVAAITRAKEMMANLVHYQSGRRYYTDDVERLAAELLPEARTGDNARQAGDANITVHHLFEVLYEFTKSPTEAEWLRDWLRRMKTDHLSDDAITEKMIMVLFDGVLGRGDWPWEKNIGFRVVR